MLAFGEKRMQVGTRRILGRSKDLLLLQIVVVHHLAEVLFVLVAHRFRWIIELDQIHQIDVQVVARRDNRP